MSTYWDKLTEPDREDFRRKIATVNLQRELVNRTLARKPHIVAITAHRALVICRECKLEYEIPVEREKLHAWLAGELIQNAMPEVSAGDRELLSSGLCLSCLDKLFPES